MFVKGEKEEKKKTIMCIRNRLHIVACTSPSFDCALSRTFFIYYIVHVVDLRVRDANCILNLCG